MNTKKTIIAAFAILVGLGLLSFKGDDRNFKIAKNLDLFYSRNWICFMLILLMWKRCFRTVLTACWHLQTLIQNIIQRKKSAV